MSWQIGPCVTLKMRAHCPSWLFTGLCLKSDILTLFVFTLNISVFHVHCSQKAESWFCKYFLLPQLYRSYWTWIYMALYFFFLQGVKMHYCLSKQFWWPYCSVYVMTLNLGALKRDQILLPVLAQPSSMVKPSQLPLQMFLHPLNKTATITARNTTFWGQQDLSRYYPIYQTNARCEWVAGRAAAWTARVKNFHSSHLVFLSSLQQKIPPCSSIAFNFARSASGV